MSSVSSKAADVSAPSSVISSSMVRPGSDVTALLEEPARLSPTHTVLHILSELLVLPVMRRPLLLIRMSVCERESERERE